MNIYPIIQFYIYIYIYYIYIYVYNICFLFIVTLLQHTHTGHTGFHIQIIFPSCFYLIIVTSRNGLPNCEHDPIYQ